jgi:alanine-glyoxylate transaminase/serine-glyoxylate transaminase/serine-pyruvate transaminase
MRRRFQKHTKAAIMDSRHTEMKSSANGESRKEGNMPDDINPSDFPTLEMPSRILLGPGPSMVDPRVLRAMSAPLIGHLDGYFLEVMDRTQELLRYVFETENRLTIPVSGTGSASMEASMANLVELGDRVLICVNGYFGLRLADMAGRYGGEVETISRPWGEVFTPDEVKQALDARPAKVVGIVHAETSTGALQPLDEIAEIVHDQGGVLVADAVTSLGGIPVRVDEVGIDVCYSGTQKCLSCPPGLGPITVSPRAEEFLAERKTPVANWYLDLTMIQKYWGKERTYHHTAPVSSNFALYEGLRILAEEGLEARWARHRENAEMLWAGLRDLGLELHVPKEHRLVSLTTVRVPEGVDEAKTRAQLMRDYNIEIAGGLGELSGKIWRIGLMGYSSRPENVMSLLGALRQILRS